MLSSNCFSDEDGGFQVYLCTQSKSGDTAGCFYKSCSIVDLSREDVKTRFSTRQVTPEYRTSLASMWRSLYFQAQKFIDTNVLTKPKVSGSVAGSTILAYTVEGKETLFASLASSSKYDVFNEPEICNKFTSIHLAGIRFLII